MSFYHRDEEGMRTIFCIICFILIISSNTVYAKDEETYNYDYTQIQETIDKSLSGNKLQFSELVDKLVSGNTDGLIEKSIDYGLQYLFYEINANRNAIVQVIVIATIGAVFSNFSFVFKNNQVSEISFYVTYLAMITILAAGLQTSVTITTDMLSALISFMRALVPAYFMAVAFVGGATSSIVYSQFMIAIITVVQYVLNYIMIPMIRIYVVIMFVNSISKEDFLSKLGEVFQTILEWALKTIIGGVMGASIIQSLIIPFIDGTRASTVQKAIKAIPGIGDGINAVSDIVIGGGVLIKNGIGVAALIVIVIITAIPMIKLGVICLLYHFAAAALQPLGENRMVDCTNAVALGTKMLLKTVFIAGMLFFITIAIICSATNAVFFAT